MNIVKVTIARIEKRATETKKPCKLYATEAKAEAVAVELAQQVATHFTKQQWGIIARPMRYVVVFIPSLGKWTAAFDMTELMGRSTSTGGYVGILSDKGFYTF